MVVDDMNNSKSCAYESTYYEQLNFVMDMNVSGLWA